MMSGTPEVICASKMPVSNEPGLENRYSAPAAFACAIRSSPPVPFTVVEPGTGRPLPAVFGSLKCFQQGLRLGDPNTQGAQLLDQSAPGKSFIQESLDQLLHPQPSL